MDLKNFTSAISQISEEKGISAERVIESIETAIAAAYKKDYGEKGQIVKAKLDTKTGVVKFWQIKTVVTEDMIYSEEELEKMQEDGSAFADSASVATSAKGAVTADEERVRFNPEKHIMLEDAEKEKKTIKAGEELEITLVPKKDYGRIAAQTAKQVVLQKIREAEREMVLEEYKSKEGEIASGIIQRVEGRNVYVDIGKTLGLMPREEQVYGEFYKTGQRLKFYILKVDETPRGPVVLLSRAYPKLISKLFELEVPEISQGQVEIRAIAREAGSRSKIAVESKEESIDPIGSAVGQRGTRVMAIINELGGEKVDIIEWAEDPEEFITNAISPAKVEEVRILPKNRAICIVPEDQLSLAIGKDGQNVRLAAKLTGWKIDVRTAADADKAEEESKKEAKEEAKKEKAEKEKPEKEEKPEKKVKKETKEEEKPKKIKKEEPEVEEKPKKAKKEEPKEEKPKETKKEDK